MSQTNRLDTLCHDGAGLAAAGGQTAPGTRLTSAPTSASVRSFSQSGLLYFSCMLGIQLILHFLAKGLTSAVPRA